MPSDNPFLQAILDRPDDDAARLVYADWLEERGDSDRAEFIRVQCELARLRRRPTPFSVVTEYSATRKRRREQLQGREYELLAQHESEWIGDLRGLTHSSAFHRGLLEQIKTTGGKLLEHGDTIFQRAPVLHLRLMRAAGKFDTLLERPWFAQLAALDLDRDSVTAAEVNLLLETQRLPNLRALRLHGLDLGDGGQRLARSPLLRQLVHVDLVATTLSDAGVTALTRSADLRKLRTLCLTHNDIGDAAVQAIARCGVLERLRYLELDYTQVGDPGLAALARPRRLVHLHALTLGHTRITDEGLWALSRSRQLPKLRTLSIYGNQVTSAALELLRVARIRVRVTTWRGARRRVRQG